MKNYYEVLGISKEATEEDVKTAYRKAAQQHHPDLNPDDAAAKQRFKEVHEAYESLIDPVKRSKYDRSLFRFRSKPSSNKDGGFSFTFQNFTNDFFGKSSFKGRTISFRIEIDLKEAAYGCEKPVKISKRKKCFACKGLGFKEFISCEPCNGLGFFVLAYDAPFEKREVCQYCDGKGKTPLKKCEECNGSMYAKNLSEEVVTVKVPAGLENGTQIKLPEMGEESLRGGSPGDLVFIVQIKPHDLFTRDGFNLVLEVPVSVTQLVFGSEIEFLNINGDKVALKVPAGTQPNSKLRLKNQGLTDYLGASGDIIATLKCEIPKDLPDDYKAVMENLRQMEEKYLGPRKQLWLKKIFPQE